MYIAIGNSIIFAHRASGEQTIRAQTATHADATRASELLNRAGYLNDHKRRYTAAARTIAQAESVAGFRWID